MADSDTQATTSTRLSSSSTASERFGLDDSSQRKLLVYRYREDIEEMVESDLAQLVNKGRSIHAVGACLILVDPSKRVTRKPIPRGTSSLDLYGYDLCLPEEKEDFKHRAAYWVNLASVPIPRNAYWNRLVSSAYEELYIVSPQSSPDNSVYSDDSRKVTPSSTWESEVTSMGATK